MLKQEYTAEQGEVLLQILVDSMMDLFTDIYPQVWLTGTTFIQMQVDCCISAAHYRDEPTTTTDIARTLGLPRASVQKAVDKMIELGKVRQEADPDDARRRLLRWSPDGIPELDRQSDILLRYMLGHINDTLKACHRIGMLNLSKDSDEALQRFVAEVEPCVLAALDKHLKK